MNSVMQWLIGHPNEANAIAAVGSAAVGTFALIIAAISMYYSWRGLSLQRTHNRLSVVPVPFIAFADYENLVRVKVRNDGIGPLLIKRIEYARDGVVNEHQDLVSYMPALPDEIHWSNFSSAYVRSIRPGDEHTLLELRGELDDTRFMRFRDLCRRELCKITIELHYTDVYGSEFDPLSRDLTWFARRLASAKKLDK